MLDGQGRTVGMVALTSPVIANVGGNVAQPQATMVTAQAIRAFLQAQAIAPASTPALAGLDAVKGAVVRVICVRK